jgi:hypothetical protein
VEFHERVLQRAVAIGVRNVRIVHRGTRRPHLTGNVDGIQIVLGLPLRPKDIPPNYFKCIADLRRIVRTIRQSAAA